MGCISFFIILFFLFAALGGSRPAIWVWALVFVAVIVAGIASKVLENAKAKNVKSKETLVSRFLKCKRYFATKRICFHSITDSTYFLADDTHKQFAVLKCNEHAIGEWVCYKYRDLLNFDVKEDGVSVLPGRGGNAVVGAVMGGVTGAVIGSVVGSKKVEEECTSFLIKIQVNNIDNPLLMIDCLNGRTYKKDSSKYKEMIEIVDEIVAVLSYIEANKNAVPQLTESDSCVIEKEGELLLNENTRHRVCHNCGSVMDADNLFCGNCGEKYEGALENEM